MSYNSSIRLREQADAYDNRALAHLTNARLARRKAKNALFLIRLWWISITINVVAFVTNLFTDPPFLTVMNGFAVVGGCFFVIFLFPKSRKKWLAVEEEQTKSIREPAIEALILRKRADRKEWDEQYEELDAPLRKKRRLALEMERLEAEELEGVVDAIKSYGFYSPNEEKAVYEYPHYKERH